MRTQRYKHYFTSPAHPGQELGTFGKSATDYNLVKDHLGYQWADSAVYARTEMLPYKYAPIVAEVIAALPGDWDAAPYGDEYEDTGFILTRADGLQLCINGPSYSHPGKFRASFSSPRGADGRPVGDLYEGTGADWKGFQPEVANIAATKTGEQIAKDIARRVLPSAEKAHVLSLEKIAKERDAADARESALAKICQALGRPLPEKMERYPEHRYSLFLQLTGAGYGTVKVREGGSLEIELRSITPDKAEAALKALLA